MILGARRVVLVCLLVACGSSDPPPELVPEEAVTPPESPPEVPAPPVTAEEVAPDPVEADEPVEASELAQLERVQATFPMLGEGVGYDQVAYPAPVQEALLRQLRSIMRNTLAGFEPSHDPDEEYPSTFSASCSATLALPTLVAYACVTELVEGRGEMTYLSSTHVWQIVGDAVREAETDDFLIEGVDYDALQERYGIDSYGPSMPTATGLAFIGQENGEVAEVPYADLGTLLNPHSVLSLVPPALAASSLATPLAAQAGPPESMNVITPALPLPLAVFEAARAGATWLFADQVGSLIDLTSSVVVEAGTPLEGTTVTDRPWATPARVVTLALRRPTQLRPAARRPAAGPILPAGTFLYAVLGELAGGPSRTGGGQWTLVVASEGRAGWLPSSLLDRAPAPPIAFREVFFASVPENERAAVRQSAITISLDRDVVFASAVGEDSLVGYVPGPLYGSAPALALSLRHPGTLADARLVPTSARYGSPNLLLLAWQLASDPSHHLWEAYAMPESGTTSASAPIFTTTLALPTAAARERVTVVTALTRRGTYYPLVVRGPGRAETIYSWDGTTLVGPPTPAPE